VAAQSPDLLFLDVALQGSDAIDVVRALREQCFRGAVQLVSGHHGLLEHIKRVGERYGLRMLAPVHKPFRAGQIEQIVDVFCFSSRNALLSYQPPTVQPPNTPMFVAVSPMVAMCRDRAREAHQGAADAIDQKIRGFWQEMEHHWLILADDYETSHIAHEFPRSRRDGRLH
jgi:CheY-like chemotaxis protein